jgi:ribosomal protein L29
MAEKKTTTKKVAKKEVSAKVVKNDFAKTAKDLRALTEKDLHEALATAKKDLLNAQKMLAANELPNTTVVKNSRKFIAKIHTVLAEKLREANFAKSEKTNEGKEQK